VEISVLLPPLIIITIIMVSVRGRWEGLEGLRLDMLRVVGTCLVERLFPSYGTSSYWGMNRCWMKHDQEGVDHLDTDEPFEEEEEKIIRRKSTNLCISRVIQLSRLRVRKLERDQG